MGNCFKKIETAEGNVKKKFLTRPLRTFRLFQKILKKLFVGLKWIEFHLKNSRNDLTCCGIRTKSGNETNHCGPTVVLFCFRSHGKKIWSKYKEESATLWVFTHVFWLWELMLLIRKDYLIIEMICAECNLFSCSFLSKWLFKWEELVMPLEAKFDSDWCIAFLPFDWMTWFGRWQQLIDKRITVV